MTFSFSYWQRSYAFTLIKEAVKLLVLGKCTIAVEMDEPADIAGLKGFFHAKEAYIRAKATGETK